MGVMSYTYVKRNFTRFKKDVDNVLFIANIFAFSNKINAIFKYTKEETILAKITAFIDKYQLSLIPGIVPGTGKATPLSYKKTKTTKQGAIYEETVN